jgi:Histidine kinase
MHSASRFVNKIILLFVIIITYKNSCAQIQPNFFVKQKNDGLQSNTIYNIHTAKNGLIYIAHGKGISSFDGNYFKNYFNKDYPYTELSNIMETDNGEIFCKSFNNAIYKINGDSTELVKFYPSDYGYMISTCYQNTIISMSRDSLFFYDAVSKQTSKKNIKSITDTSMPKDFIFGGYAPIYKEFYLFFVDKNFDIHKIKSSEKYRGNFHFSNGNGFLSKDKSIEKIYYLNKDIVLNSKAKKENTLVNYITCIDSVVWICTTNGIYFFDINKGESTIEYILEGFNTTDVNKTFENNYAISTLGNGLIFIPSFEIKFLPNTPKNITTISGNTNSLFLGTKDGDILNYNIQNHNNLFVEKALDKLPIQFLLHDGFSNTTINSTSLSTGLSTNNRKKFIIKDYTYVHNELLLATNYGIRIYSHQPIQSWLKNYIVSDTQNTKAIQRLSIFNEYVATVKYDAVHDKIFVNTYDGIFEFANGYTKPIKLPEPGCVLKDLACYNGLLYLATKDQGIVTWDGKKYQPLQKNNPTNDILLKFENFENELWVLGENAIYCYTNNDCKIYDKKFGIDVEKAIGIYVNKQFVYINNGDNIVSFPKNIYGLQIPKPLFTINSFTSSKQKKQIEPNAKLSFDDNILKINFSLIAYANAQNTHLAYSINNQDTFHLQNNIRDINLNNLSPDKYSIAFFVVSNGIINPKVVRNIQFTIAPPFYKTWWFSLLIIIAILLLAYYIFHTILARWKKDTLQKEAKILLEKELDKSMLTSIKAQMNPHFLFNALNTIQSYIYSNDKQNASRYISKFSNLTRSILEMSNKETISLDEEINSLKLYLELEKMRFEDTLNYYFEIEAGLQKDQIKIPSMLLQPYVENALKHGLLHKKTNRELHLHFTKENNLLKIVIDDNGIGRKKSQELNAIKNRDHQSFAMDANKKRLEILKHNFKEIHFEIIDKYSELGEASGTQVVILLPM